jgi:hypothetical protein
MGSVAGGRGGTEDLVLVFTENVCEADAQRRGLVAGRRHDVGVAGISCVLVHDLLEEAWVDVENLDAASNKGVSVLRE